jgi:hypothetical protein
MIHAHMCAKDNNTNHRYLTGIIVKLYLSICIFLWLIKKWWSQWPWCELPEADEYNQFKLFTRCSCKSNSSFDFLSVHTYRFPINTVNDVQRPVGGYSIIVPHEIRKKYQYKVSIRTVILESNKSWILFWDWQIIIFAVRKMWRFGQVNRDQRTFTWWLHWENGC